MFCFEYLDRAYVETCNTFGFVWELQIDDLVNLSMLNSFHCVLLLMSSGFRACR